VIDEEAAKGMAWKLGQGRCRKSGRRVPPWFSIDRTSWRWRRETRHAFEHDSPALEKRIREALWGSDDPMIDWHQKFAFLQLVLARPLSVEQAARRYGCHPRTALQRLAEGVA